MTMTLLESRHLGYSCKVPHNYECILLGILQPPSTNQLIIDLSHRLKYKQTQVVFLQNGYGVWTFWSKLSYGPRCIRTAKL